ncbi:acyl-CoA synthetase [Mycolicibacterium murale]|uniref:Acyl-CoA synthetase n=1 Tax=Mycolicibacterium murale TaxID=182220 RepID=A0A7I9WGK1_9MYCO|nr:AMP-binding protein [Mycolicibacterium murale]MCV7180603.1 AMP-binding protein [Mycolicibacterium murale]GFG56824.1 acyl-CoA synthetase [Mycolicibacterium murale]
MTASRPGWHHLGDLLAGAPRQSTALIVDRAPVTYGELDDLVGTRARGISGRVVPVTGGNTLEYVVTLLAAARAGAVVAPLDPALPEAERTRRLALLDDPAGLRDGDAMIMLTSGTTGTPKLVPWTHQSLSAGVHAVVDSYGLTAQDATVAVMPLFHGHGLVATLLATLTSRGTVLLPAAGRFSAHTFAADMAAANATWYTAVPTIHQIVVRRGDPLPPLRFIRSCSAPLRPDLVSELEQRFDTQVLAAYGMTETTHQAATVRLGADAQTRRNTVGVPSGLQVRIINGEICFRGPTVMRGYLGTEPADPFADGWLRTGDLGAVDPDGNLIVTGRCKNLINRGGEKISPEHVEQVLAGCPGVLQAAVVGVPDALYGEQVTAAVVITADTDPGRIAEHCRALLAPFEIPQRFIAVPALPQTPKGDVDRATLAVMVGEFPTRVPGPACSAG